jgi:phage virion morphogenesis protein
MSGAGVEITGIESALSRLSEASERLENPYDLFAAIGAAGVSATRRRFETETGPGGSPWPMSIRAMMQGGRTMTESARLVNSIFWAADQRSARWGTNVIYAAIHQTGGTIRAKTAKALFFRIGGQAVQVQSVTIPPRPFLGIDEDDAAEIEATALDFLNDAFGGDGGGGDAAA